MSHVLLTGTPGCGKTTLIHRVCSMLKAKGLNVHGFYTEEVRENGQRIGFDVVDLSGRRSVLSRVGSGAPKVGQYSVNVQSFESVAIPALEAATSSVPECILVIDEVGKMELFSNVFQSQIRAIFRNPKLRILATIPVRKGMPLPLVEELRNRPDVVVITVTRENRNVLPEQISAKYF